MPLLLAFVAAVGMFAGYRLDENYILSPSKDTQNGGPNIGSGNFDELLKYIDARYVDDIDVNRLSEETVQLMLKRLDPFSRYVPPGELRRYQEQISGIYTGVGFELKQIADSIYVYRVYPKSPAHIGGIKPANIILSVNELQTIGYESLVDTLKSCIQSTEMLRIVLKNLENNQDTITLQKAEIEQSSVASAYSINDSVAYIKLSTFSQHSYRDFMEALEKLADKSSVRHLILDLRDNPGGVLDEAVKILQQFYKKPETLLLYTQGAHSSKKEYKTIGRPFFDIGNIAVLINKHSASASEIIAGAIQDTDRGVIIGSNSYGKGLVQEQYSLKNGGALRLTIARYYTPSGRLIQREYEHTYSRFSTDSSRHIYTTKNGRKVTSGGGIQADIPIDQNEIWHALEQSPIEDIGYKVVLDTYKKHAQNEDFGLDYVFKMRKDISMEMFQSLSKLANEEQAEFINAHQTPVLRTLYSELVYLIGGKAQAVKINNEEDPVVGAALNYFESKGK